MTAVNSVTTAADGTLAAMIDGEEWGNITEASRFWPLIEEWVQSGNVIHAYVPPSPPVPSMVSRRQFFQQAAIATIITQNDALAAMTSGTLPAVISSFIATLPTDQQFGAKMLFSSSEFERSSPMANAFGATISMTPEQIDAFFVAASKL